MPMIEHTKQEQRQAAVSSTMERLLAHWYAITKQPHSGINLIEFLAEADDGPVLSLEKVRAAPAELEDHRPQVKDPLEEVNVGTADDPRILFISALLPPATKAELRKLLQEFKDCFAWSYHEMPGLDRNLVEHELRIRDGCKPFRQPPRRFSTELQLGIKEELVRLLKAGFIRTARYVEWLANIVPVLKKNGALRICTDFRNLNLATPKDEYTMPISDLLIDAAANHELLSFMDGHAGYNQIFIAEADVHKTAFRCPGALGTYEWVVMPFGLKNAGATYQRAMNMIFHDLIGTIVEVYIDDVVVKSKRRQTHLDDLRQAFLRMRKNSLKMNPAKCAFGVSAGNFLGFLVHHRGIEVDANKARAIISAPPPTTKKQLQSLLGQINFLRRFIANSAGKMKAFSTLLKLKDTDKFVWREEHQSAFTQIKVALSTPPVLVPPCRTKPLKLYISAAAESIGCLLAQDNNVGREQAVFYLSRNLNAPELNYSPVEKLCLALFFAASKLRHYMLPSVTQVIAQTDVIRYMLTRPIVKGRIGKWTLALSEFSLQYVPQKAVKGQALADFLAQHPSPYGFEGGDVDIGLVTTRDNHWTMHFDGSSTSTSAVVLWRHITWSPHTWPSPSNGSRSQRQDFVQLHKDFGGRGFRRFGRSSRRTGCTSRALQKGIELHFPRRLHVRELCEENPGRSPKTLLTTSSIEAPKKSQMYASHQSPKVSVPKDSGTVGRRRNFLHRSWNSCSIDRHSLSEEPERRPRLKREREASRERGNLGALWKQPVSTFSLDKQHCCRRISRPRHTFSLDKQHCVEFGLNSACLYSYEYNHSGRIRLRRVVNSAELVALSSGYRIQRPRAFLPRSQSQDTEVNSALNATASNFTPQPSSADELARPAFNRRTVVSSLVIRPARHVGSVIFRVNRYRF
ncbi:hypothetical protein D8674_010131 [Pyrus ussuriensis x Pyrus communis]|uniref:Reverse transcriptase domain-containing protein n=1 Tax=Pyrus ussuriensis x Pyrus communis TaxID=2448454 RepID=A0A5N5FF86_9ROSA|nr:hypothetical protein D8674_010131 [Pyrus ussuriensis x Pyrus communis]